MISVGLHVPHFGPLAEPDVMASTVELAEELEFGTAWVSDHIAIPVDFTTPYPYTATGRIGLPAEAPFFDPFVALAFAAGRTERIRLGISALVLPYRHPLLAAKLIGSVDAISGGRLRVVVGIGWLREEFDALGIEFTARGRITDEHVDAIGALLSGGQASFAGDTVRFEEMGMRPAPVQQPFPLIVGGHSRLALRRALRVGHGWQATPEQPSEVSAMVARLREEAGGTLPPGFLVATRLHLPRFDPSDDGEPFLDAMRVATLPGVSDLTIDIVDRDADRYHERLGTVARWLRLRDGMTNVLG